MRSVVGIDASRYAIQQRTGTETYSFELINALAALPELPFDVRLYANTTPADGWQGVARLGTPREIPFPRFWTHARLSSEMVRHPPDMLFVPSHVVPLIHPPSVVTIHDLGYLHEPAAHPARQRLMLDWTTRWNARSQHIIAISETTRRDLVERYSVPNDRITVVAHGVSSRFAPVSPDNSQQIRSRYGLPETFVLALGTIQPRKNLVRLAKAVAELDGVALVTVGRRGWMAGGVCSEIQRILPQAGQWVEPGYVPLADLPALLSAASVVAMVSTYEGFGLPVLEAMACATPVVISDTPALVEVAGGAARI
ncbi:MAG TPA: glycosyltransferase family 1 protein, partial [Thermomicrobiales bacterium]|nr:glycosyltransferase family 1 protein [Thermomicrobiales bacterium]